MHPLLQELRDEASYAKNSQRNPQRKSPKSSGKGFFPSWKHGPSNRHHHCHPSRQTKEEEEEKKYKMGKIKPDRGLVHIEVITSQSRTTNNPQRDTTSHPEVSSYIDVCDCVCHSPPSVEFASLESFLPLERQHAAHCLVRAVID